MLKTITTLIISLALLASSAIASSKLKTQEQKASYTIGVQLGTQLMISKDDIELDALKMGMKDIFSGTATRLSNDEMRQAMMNYQEKKKMREVAMATKFSAHNKKEGADYLAKNKNKKGVVTLPSGLQYKVLRSGNGKSPKLTDTVVTNYHGTLIDGTVFDSSMDRGKSVSFPVNAVIKGWTEALLKMKIGDKWELVIPSHLAYGEQGAPPKITPGATLVFIVELLDIK